MEFCGLQMFDIYKGTPNYDSSDKIHDDHRESQNFSSRLIHRSPHESQKGNLGF